MGKIIDRVRARQDLMRERAAWAEVDAFDRMLHSLARLSVILDSQRKEQAGEIMLMANRGDEVQH